MKVLIAHNYTINSFAAMSVYLARALVKQGHQVMFISHRPIFKDKFKDEHGIEIVSWPEKRATGLKSFLFYYSLHKRFKPDVVISHFGSVNISMFVSWLFKTKLRVTYYHTLMSQNLIDQKQSIKEKFFVIRKNLIYSFVTDIIFVSRYAKQDFLKYYNPLKKVRQHVIYNGLPDRFIEQKNVDKKSTPVKLFNYLGRIEKSKGLLEFIEAFKHLHKKHPNIKLKIAGDGKLVGALKKEIKDVSFIEYIGNIPYKEVDTFLMQGYFNICPSKSDNLPTVVLESFLNGKPVIASNRGGIPEIITHESDGFLFSDFDTNSISACIQRAINLSDHAYEEMQQNARKKFLDKFEMTNYIHNMCNFIGNGQSVKNSNVVKY